MEDGYYMGENDGGVRPCWMDTQWYENDSVAIPNGHPVPTMRSTLDAQQASETSASRRVGWRYCAMSPFNHYVVGEKPNGGLQGQSLCGIQMHPIADWLPESSGLQRCPQCALLLPRLV